MDCEAIRPNSWRARRTDLIAEEMGVRGDGGIGWAAGQAMSGHRLAFPGLAVVRVADGP